MTERQKNNILREYLDKCVRCGQCRYVCPVLDILGKESASPRGKLYLAGLLERGEVSPGPRAQKLLSLCLVCGACSAQCPSGLPVDRIIAAARASAASGRPYSPYRLIYRSFFSQMHIWAKLPGFTPLFRGMGGVSPGGPGAARSGIARINRPQLKKPRLRVGYFLGCATNHLLPEVAFSLVKVLTHLGCEVIVPPAACCGLPLAAEGEKTAVQKTMEINRRLFREHRLDAVVTDCSSCSHHLTELGLTGDAQPVYEFCEFLVKVINPEKPSLAFNEAVACHYPCHLKHGRKLAGHLHQIISSIPGVNVVEIPGGTSCCGGGGAFYKKENALSAQILQKYTGRLLSSGARSVATLCPSCILQLNRGLAVHNVPVRHAAQLLHTSYGLPGSQN